VKPASTPRHLVHTKKKTWRDSLPIDMLLSACLGCCAAELGSSGRPYELPCVCWPKCYNSCDSAARRVNWILLLVMWVGRASKELPLQNKKWPLLSETTTGQKNVAHLL
jgi:hypothetical protein